jgi:hypothetical protein
MAVDPRTKKVMRGAIIKLVYQKYERQETRFNSRTLMAALDDLAFRVYENLVFELLQALADSGYLTCEELRDGKTGEKQYMKIQLTRNGRDLYEGIITDPAVDVE